VGETEGVAGVTPGDGAEAVEVDAEGDDGDLVFAGGVELAQGGCFLLGGADDAVGAAQDLGFGVDAQGRFVLAVGGAVLDLAEGVEHDDVGDAPEGLEAGADEAGEPVVGVDEVVGGGLGGGEGEQGFVEGVEVAVQGFGREGRLGPGDEVDDAEVGGCLDDRLEGG
jgi:hypothetical protein